MRTSTKARERVSAREWEEGGREAFSSAKTEFREQHQRGRRREGEKEEREGRREGREGGEEKRDGGRGEGQDRLV